MVFPVVTFYRIFNKTQAITLTSTSGSSEGGATIHIAGELFRPHDNLGCRVGMFFVPAMFVSSSSIFCTVTGPVVPGSFEIWVTDNGVDFVRAGNFTFLPKTTVTALTPASGPISGGLLVLLEGNGFSVENQPSCSFDGVVVSAEVLSDTEARCITPLMARSVLWRSTSLLAPVDFSNNGVDFDSRADGGLTPKPVFLFYPEPLVHSIAPAGGLTEGEKTTIVVTGVDLAKHGTEMLNDGEFVCRQEKDGLLAAGVVISPTQATCDVTCGNYSGPMSFMVSLNGGASWTTSAVDFICYPLPRVTSIFPPIGPATGGTTLTVRGSGFESGASLSCFIGGAESSSSLALWISNSMVECLTPQASGTRRIPTNNTVSISNDGTHFSEPILAATFQYVPSPTVWRVIPSFVSVSGKDTSVIVTGTNFVNNSISSCHFRNFLNQSNGSEESESVSSPVTFLTTAQVTCFVPSGRLRPGPALLTVSVNGFDSNGPGVEFELEALPEISKIVPGRGMAGVTVTSVEVSVESL